VRFADTAGLRTTADAIEAAGIERSLASHATADLTVQVADLSQPWTDEDRHLVLALGKRPTLLAHNKADLLGPDAAHPLPDRPPGIAVSARTGIGLERLLDAVIERLVPVPPAVDDALPFTPAIVAALEETRRQLSAGQLAAGQLSAGQLAAGQGNMASSRLAEFL
jgi:tRNA modification GTPase